MKKRIKKVGRKIIIGGVAFASPVVFVGGVIGYFTGKYFAGKKDGHSGILKSIIFNIGNYKIHLHHWFIGLGVLILAFFDILFSLSQLSFGFLSGVAVHGIHCYNDWKRILMKK